MDTIRGYRTYILASSAILAAIAAYLGGETNGAETTLAIIAALGLVTARIGSTNDAAKVERKASWIAGVEVARKFALRFDQEKKPEDGK
ncbi:MAG TPA: hypothetical protein VIH11_08815 [Gemmatimonadaceae bacterium]